MSESPNRRSTKPKRPHRLEWMTGGVSAALVLLIIIWLVREAVFTEDPPPSFVVRQTSATPVNGRYRVEFDVTNEGGKTAAAVIVRAGADAADGLAETIDVTFDYVPANSTTTGSAIFSKAPASDTITLEVVGYTDP